MRVYDLPPPRPPPHAGCHVTPGHLPAPPCPSYGRAAEALRAVCRPVATFAGKTEPAPAGAPTGRDCGSCRVPQSSCRACRELLAPEPALGSPARRDTLVSFLLMVHGAVVLPRCGETMATARWQLQEGTAAAPAAATPPVLTTPLLRTSASTRTAAGVGGRNCSCRRHAAAQGAPPYPRRQASPPGCTAARQRQAELGTSCASSASQRPPRHRWCCPYRRQNYQRCCCCVGSHGCHRRRCPAGTATAAKGYTFRTQPGPAVRCSVLGRLGPNPALPSRPLRMFLQGKGSAIEPPAAGCACVTDAATAQPGSFVALNQEQPRVHVRLPPPPPDRASPETRHQPDPIPTLAAPAPHSQLTFLLSCSFSLSRCSRVLIRVPYSL